MSLNERMNKLNRKPSLTSEELEQVTGGGGLPSSFGVVKSLEIKYDNTPVFSRPDGQEQVDTLNKGDYVATCTGDQNGYTGILIGGGRRPVYVSTGALLFD